MILHLKKRLSKDSVILLLTVLFIMLTLILRNIQLSVENRNRVVIEGDVLHYYAFLPAILAYQDLNLEFVAKDPAKFSDRFWPVVAPNGKYVIMTTMGMSIMYSPFIVPVHYFLKLTGQNAEGYSSAYNYTLIVASLFYTLLALILLIKILRQYYSSKTISIVLILLTLGTNLIHYNTREPAFSHVFSFFLIIWLTYCIDKYYKNNSIYQAVLVGFILGLITLVRPTNAVVMIIIPFWKIGSIYELKMRITTLLKNWHHIIIFGVAILITWLPQIIYWKSTAGAFFFNGYGDGGKFFFGNPQLINILFSYRKGWLLYTPSMIIAIIGFYWLYKNNRPLFFPIVIYFVINTWILASWWLWWFGGSYGNRAFIDMYGLLAFPIAAFLDQLNFSKYRFLRLAPIFLLFVFVAHNLFQLQQYHNGAIHYVSMTKEAYWESFGKLKPEGNFNELLVFPDYELAKKGIYPKPEVKVPEKIEKNVQFYEKQLRNSPEMIRLLEEKAIKENISLDSMIKRDALWLYKNKK